MKHASIIITALAVLLCLAGCQDKTVPNTDELGTITAPTHTPDVEQPGAENVAGDIGSSFVDQDEPNQNSDNSVQDPQSAISDDAGGEGETNPPIDLKETTSATRGEGVPHTTRTLAQKIYNSDVSGKAYGVITNIEEGRDGLWYITMTEHAREDGSPVTDPQGIEHKTINAVPTGKELVFCVSRSCSFFVWEPYSGYDYTNAGSTVQDLKAAMRKTTVYGEPYYFEFSLRNGLIYELSLWCTFYDYQMYKHGLAGVIYSDGSAIGGAGGLLPDVADQYKQREINGVSVEARPTPTPMPVILEPTLAPIP